jgi:2-oxoglutarate ferredoxin oxidoreductase subunit delta
MLAQKNYEMSAFCTPVGKNNESVFYIFPQLCKGCGLCVVKCPAKTLSFGEELGLYGTPLVRPGNNGIVCTACGICQTFCPDCAIRIDRG